MSAIYRVTFKFLNGDVEIVEGSTLKEIMALACALMDEKGTTLYDMDVHVIPRSKRVGEA